MKKKSVVNKEAEVSGNKKTTFMRIINGVKVVVLASCEKEADLLFKSAENKFNSK
mgnify:CR=1 FL=1